MPDSKINAGHDYNVPRTIEIPQGATHYDSARVHKFVRIVDDRRWTLIEGSWREDKKPKQSGWPYVSKIVKLEIPNKAKRFNTPHGPGVLIGHCHGQTLIDLDNNPFSFRPAAFFRNEITKIPQETGEGI